MTEHNGKEVLKRKRKMGRENGAVLAEERKK
jgi:ribosomal protein L34